jgi:hypothetical protein
MALETKIILKMIIEIVKLSKTKEELLKRLESFANTEGVVEPSENESPWGE